MMPLHFPRPALALALAAACVTPFGPALAEDVHAWGGSGPSTQSSVTISSGAGGAHVATVTYVNRLIGGGPNDLTVTLSAAGVRVSALVEQLAGTTPDRLTITPEDGYIAVPPTLTLGEGETGVINIFELGAMVMGALHLDGGRA